MIQRVLCNEPYITEKIRMRPNPVIRSDPDPRVNTSFSDIFNQKLESNRNLTFSAHAEQRLNQRNIYLSKNDFMKLENAVNQLNSKGGKQSLIMMNDVSYVVNVRGKKVITAIDSNNTQEKIFTDIDSAMII